MAPRPMFLHGLLPMVALGVAACNPLYDHLDNPMKVQEILGTTLSESERVIPGAGVEECHDQSARIASRRLSTYAAPTQGFWFVEDHSLPPDKFEPTMDYSIDHWTTCSGPHSGMQPEIVVQMTFRNISPYVCVSAYDLNVAMPGLLKSRALDSFADIFFYQSPRNDILVSFNYQYHAKCLYAIELEQSDRVRRVRSGSFWQRS